MSDGARQAEAGTGRDAAATLGPRVTIVLASTSPRRKELLARLGIEFEVISPGLDDADLHAGAVDLAQWVASLSYLKAVAGTRQLRQAGRELSGVLVIGADTLVGIDGRVLSKAASAHDAARMIRLVRGRDHEVYTGVTLLAPFAGRREVFTDRATVTVGHITDEAIDAYVATDGWRGKAGGYNLSERQQAGWPMTVTGDEGTVMGLPIERLRTRLAKFVRANFGISTMSTSGVAAS